MNGGVIAIAFTEAELKHLRERMRTQGEVHISSVIRRSFGFTPRYAPEHWVFAEDFEEIDNMKKLVNAVYYLGALVSGMLLQNGNRDGHPGELNSNNNNKYRDRSDELREWKARRKAKELGVPYEHVPQPEALADTPTADNPIEEFLIS